MSIESLLTTELNHITNMKEIRPESKEVVHFILRLMEEMRSNGTVFSEEHRVACAATQMRVFGCVTHEF